MLPEEKYRLIIEDIISALPTWETLDRATRIDNTYSLDEALVMRGCVTREEATVPQTDRRLLEHAATIKEKLGVDVIDILKGVDFIVEE